MRALAVLRPEPGNAATAARIVAAGGVAIRLPLFVVEPRAWDVPDAAAHDALLLTSANAVRHAGGGQGALAGLPVVAVGAATAAAARGAGLTVVETGAGDVAAVLATTQFSRLLHLGGVDRVAIPSDRVTQVVAVYASVAVDVDASMLAGTVALLHSARAARRLAGLVDPAQVRIAALSTAVAGAAGGGWAAVAVARSPTDAALVAAAMSLAD